MKKQDFFERIAPPILKAEERIVKILKARGFLIDRTSDGYFLSDNSADQDREYLSELLCKYDIGIVENNSNKKNKHIGNTSLPKIIINQTADVNIASILFNDFSRVSMEATDMRFSWSHFARREHGRKVPVSFLEPYVSYYVKAISACGVDTCFSCDGNHINGGRIVVFANYPFNVWHQIIWEKYLGEAYRIGNQGILYSDDDKYEHFFKLYSIADRLYEDRIHIRRIKNEICRGFSRKYLKRESENNLEILFVDACEKYDWR